MTRLFVSFVCRASLVIALCGVVQKAESQELLPAPRPCVSEDLPVHHWSVEVAQRLQALGMVEDLSTDGVVASCRVEQILASALADPSTDPELLRRIEAWRALLAAERNTQSLESARENFGIRATDLAIGGRGTRGAAAPGFAEFEPDRTGAVPIANAVRFTSSASVTAHFFKRVYLTGEVTSSGADFLVDRLEIVAPLGPVTGTIGRGYNRLGDTKGGSIIFSGVAPLDRVELSTSSPFRLPWVLDRIGDLSFTTVLATVQDHRHADEPLFWMMRGSVQPHERLELSVNRAALFGGDQRMRLDNLGMMLLGRVQGKGFEDQIVSVEGRLRLPTEGVLPLTAVVEWGAEDAAGAWFAVPGIVFSLQAPVLPGAGGVSAAVEYATFGTSCCLNPEWYRHWSFPGSWALGDSPMGHPLGGNGSELLLTTSAHLANATVRLRNDLFVRSRGEENLYAPERAGRSAGLRTHALWRVYTGVEMESGFNYEAGDGWSDRSLTILGKLFF